MHIVTGGAGFIGSACVWKLNQQGIEDILVVDELGTSEKWKNLRNLKFSDYLHKDAFLKALLGNQFSSPIDGIIHMGACSSTTELNMDYLMENNYRYTRQLAEWAVSNGVRFIYASSAATYGDGEQGYSDEAAQSEELRPMNPYGYSKQIFDLWAIRHQMTDKMVGLKFFNVFGPNEYHKGEMRSVVHKSFEQIRDTGKVKLFKSYRSEYADGEQKRDFIYIKDCVETIWWLLNHPTVNGIFNLGTSHARTWKDLVTAVFHAMEKPVAIDYIDMPETIRDRYQYFTQAEMGKLERTGCPLPRTSLETAIHDYVTNYLALSHPYLSS